MGGAGGVPQALDTAVCGPMPRRVAGERPAGRQVAAG